MFPEAEFSEAEYCAGHGTHIGIHQDIELNQLDYVAQVAREFLKSNGISR